VYNLGVDASKTPSSCGPHCRDKKFLKESKPMFRPFNQGILDFYLKFVIFCTISGDFFDWTRGQGCHGV
jgi:hypothetical protein